VAGHIVIGLIGRWLGPVPGASVVHAVDLTNIAAVTDWVRRIRPDVVVNAAAIAEPAACEAAPALSQTVNVDLPAGLAEACARTGGTRFVHISSEQVFDGKSPPYTIHDEPKPLNLYGRQKIESEQRVLAADPGSAVVRAPLLLGNSLSGRRSVHEKLFELWAEGGVAKLYSDEFRQVCSAENLAAVLVELAGRRELRGVMHWAGAALISRFELGRQLAAHFRLPDDRITAVRRSDNPIAAAKRPASLALNLSPLEQELRTRPQKIKEALKELAVPAHFDAWQQNPWFAGRNAPAILQRRNAT
jgi:dTDP-4-dehydrorhamnose reductase